MMTASISLRQYCCLLSFFATLMLVIGLSSNASLAQDSENSETPVAEKSEETGPSFPPGLDDVKMDIKEFQLRLIPLTAKELSALAARWQQIVRTQTEKVVEATVEAEQKGSEQAQEDIDSIVALTKERGDAFDRYTSVVNNLEKKNGDEAEIAALRAYRNAILVEEKQRADWRTLLNQALSWAQSPEGGLSIARSFALLLGSFIALIVVARIVRAYARRLFKRVPDLSKLLQAFLAMTVYWITITIGLMVVLSAIGVDISPLFALVGGASFIMAFAMQETLGNLAAGLMIMLNRPFDEGDFVTSAGTSGTVKSVSIVSTTVTTPDNQVIVIPNSKVWSDIITNATATEQRRVDLQFGIDYGDDQDKAIDIILDVAKADDRVLDEPEPWVRVTNLGESSVDLTARLWCKTEDYWELKFALTKAVKLAFDQNGISIPYPHSVEIKKEE